MGCFRYKFWVPAMATFEFHITGLSKNFTPHFGRRPQQRNWSYYTRKLIHVRVISALRLCLHYYLLFTIRNVSKGHQAYHLGFLVIYGRFLKQNWNFFKALKFQNFNGSCCNWYRKLESKCHCNGNNFVTKCIFILLYIRLCTAHAIKNI